MFSRGSFTGFGFCVSLFSIIVLHAPVTADDSSLDHWNNAGLLDSNIRANLKSYEKFFFSLYSSPAKYDSSSESDKNQMVDRWIIALGSSSEHSRIAAAAYLGIVKAPQAADPLEKKLSSGIGGRFGWVCTRSLGQIGNKSSVPVLAALLDNRNRNTRVYAKASLAEITGRNYSGGKEPASPRGSEKSNNSAAGSLRKGYSRSRLDFQMPDIYGRIVDSKDYTSVPVLVFSGSCWCGGCQADCVPFRKLTAEFAPAGLMAIRTVAGDNELAAMDFQKHYRLDFVQLLDTDRSFEKRYNNTGKWSFIMLADTNGRIVSKINRPEEYDWNKLRQKLSGLFSSAAASRTVTRDSIKYLPATLKRTNETETQNAWEIFPSIACDPSGKIYVVFTTNRNGSSDIYLRVFDGTKWSGDIPVAATKADEYDAKVMVDTSGSAWISWVSNGKGSTYQVYITTVSDKDRFVPVQVSFSDDDAMHPRMACDEKGRVWITYYKWHKMKGVSRDKEVYVRRIERSTVSEEIRISPQDVSEYEDHTEPVIAAYGNGALVGWSWDFHPPNAGYSNQGQTPTVFFRPINGNLKAGKISRISAKNIDVTPGIAIDRNRKIWFAWDSLAKNQRKNICLGNPSISRDYPVDRIYNLNKSTRNVCSPCFSERPSGGLTLVWCETADGSNWSLKRSDLNSKNEWTLPSQITTEGNPRFASAAYDSNGQLWTAYSSQTDQSRRVLVKRISENIQQATIKKTESDETSANEEAIKRLRRAIDTRYSYRDLRGVDWDKAFEKYQRYMLNAKTPAGFAKATARMLDVAKDAHIWVKADGVPVKGSFKRIFRPNYDLDNIQRSVPSHRDLSRYVSAGKFQNGTGYILIKSWTKDEEKVLKPAMRALRELSACPALIIDVRPNSGGAEPLAGAFAGCFIDKPVVYAKHAYPDTASPTGWRAPQERILRPSSAGLKYNGKVAVLMGQENMSSCDAFLLMMKQIPGCKLIGDRSYGSSGNPKEHNLGNGVSVWLPSWKAMRPDGTCFEGEGIMPDIRVRTVRAGKSDRVLETALKVLGRNN